MSDEERARTAAATPADPRVAAATPADPRVAAAPGGGSPPGGRRG